MTEDLIQIETLLCDAHQMNFSLYCFNCEQPLCLGCNSVEAAAAEAVFENDATKKKLKSAHEGHFVKSIKEVLRVAGQDKTRFRTQIQENENKIAAAMNYFSGLQEIFAEQRDLFIKKTNADFDVIIKLVQAKRAEMTTKIAETYANQMHKCN
jgi:hypothetical protein